MDKLIGSDSQLDREARLLNAMSLASFLATTVMLISNVILANPYFQWMLSAFAALSSGVIYCASRFAGRTELRVHFCVLAFLLTVIAWFTNEGSRGGAVWLFFVLAVGATGLLRASHRLPFLLALGFTVTAMLLLEWLEPNVVLRYGSDRQREDDLAVMFLVCLVFTCSIAQFLVEGYRRERDRTVALYRQLKEKNARVEEALREVGVLEGLLPICSHCKSIRDAEGEWQMPETYLRGRSAQGLTHRICQRCHERNLTR